MLGHEIALLIGTEGTPGGGIGTLGDHVWVNLTSDAWTMKDIPQVIKADDNSAGFQNPQGRVWAFKHEGDLKVKLRPEHAKILIEASKRGTAGDMKTLWANVVNAHETGARRGYVGIIVEQAVITGKTSDGEVNCTLTLKALSSGAALTSGTPTYTNAIPFSYSDMTGSVTMGGAVGNCAEWTWTIKNNIKEGAMTGGTYGHPSSLVAGAEEVTAKVTAWLENDTLLANCRTGTATEFKVVLDHPTAATNGSITLGCMGKLLEAPTLKTDPKDIVQVDATVTGEKQPAADQCTATVGN